MKKAVYLTIAVCMVVTFAYAQNTLAAPAGWSGTEVQTKSTNTSIPPAVSQKKSKTAPAPEPTAAPEPVPAPEPVLPPVPAPAPAEPTESIITLNGEIIDNVCAGAQATENLSDFVKTHTKECALMPGCAESGYSIYADGKLAKFDKESNAKVEAFLKGSDNKLSVVVTAKKVGDELILVSIENQK